VERKILAQGAPWPPGGRSLVASVRKGATGVEGCRTGAGRTPRRVGDPDGRGCRGRERTPGDADMRRGRRAFRNCALPWLGVGGVGAAGWTAEEG